MRSFHSTSFPFHSHFLLTTKTKQPNRGMFYDVETRSETNSGCYLQIASSPPSTDKEISSWLAQTVTSKSSRFGANGGCTLKTVSPLKTISNENGEFKECVFTFDTLSPSMRELQRRARVRCSWPPRKGECCVLVLQGGVGESYKKVSRSFDSSNPMK